MPQILQFLYHRQQVPDLLYDGYRINEWVDQKDKSSYGKNRKKEIKYEINRKKIYRLKLAEISQ